MIFTNENGIPIALQKIITNQWIPTSCLFASSWRLRKFSSFNYLEALSAGESSFSMQKVLIGSFYWKFKHKHGNWPCAWLFSTPSPRWNLVAFRELFCPLWQVVFSIFFTWILDAPEDRPPEWSPRRIYSTFGCSIRCRYETCYHWHQICCLFVFLFRVQAESKHLEKCIEIFLELHRKYLLDDDNATAGKTTISNGRPPAPSDDLYVVIGALIDWWIDRQLLDCISWCRLIDWSCNSTVVFVDLLFVHSIDWLIYSLFDLSIDRVIDRVIDCLMEWLID